MDWLIYLKWQQWTYFWPHLEYDKCFFFVREIMFKKSKENNKTILLLLRVKNDFLFFCPLCYEIRPHSPPCKHLEGKSQPFMSSFWKIKKSWSVLLYWQKILFSLASVCGHKVSFFSWKEVNNYSIFSVYQKCLKRISNEAFQKLSTHKRHFKEIV